MFETWNVMSAMRKTIPEPRKSIASIVSACLPSRDWEQAFAAARAGGTGKNILDWTEL